MPPGYQPPRSETARREITPPSPHRATILPIADIGSRKFEELCLDVVRSAFPDIVVGASLKRTSGVEQFGVDVEGFDGAREPAVVVSAKCYRKVNAWDFRVWLDDFVKHLDGHWKGRAIRYFVLAVTHETNDDGMSEAARKVAKALASRGIEFRLWNLHSMTEILRART